MYFFTSKGWLDCYVSLGELYLELGGFEVFEERVRHNMSWLASVLSADKQRNLTTTSSDAAALQGQLRTLMSLSKTDRVLLSSEIRVAWNVIETVREALTPIVEEFVSSDSRRIRLGLFLE